MRQVIFGNTIAGSFAWGLALGFGSDQLVANFNIIRANIITQNRNVGILMVGGMGNIIVANTLDDPTLNAADSGMENRWDDGHQGNYWCDYQGQDRDGDGIGDSPYTVSPNGIDNYPLVEPPQSLDIPP